MSVIYKTLKKLRTPQAAVENRAVMIKKERGTSAARKKRFYLTVAIVFLVANIVLAIGIHYGLGQFDLAPENSRLGKYRALKADNRIVVVRKPVKTDQSPAAGTASYLPPTKKSDSTAKLQSPQIAAQKLPPVKPARQADIQDSVHEKKLVAAKSPKLPAYIRPVTSRPKKAVPREYASEAQIQQARAEKLLQENLAKSLKVSRLIARIRQSMKLNGSGGDTEMMLKQLESIKGKNNPFVMKLRAFWCIEKGEYDRALPLLEKVTGRNEKDLEAGLNLAVLEIKANQLQAARVRLTRLSQIYPENNQVVEMLMQVKKHTRPE